MEDPWRNGMWWAGAGLRLGRKLCRKSCIEFIVLVLDNSTEEFSRIC